MIDNILRYKVTYKLFQLAIAALGRIEGLLDYNRIRADTASMIY